MEEGNKKITYHLEWIDDIRDTPQVSRKTHKQMIQDHSNMPNASQDISETRQMESLVEQIKEEWKEKKITPVHGAMDDVVVTSLEHTNDALHFKQEVAKKDGLMEETHGYKKEENDDTCTLDVTRRVPTLQLARLREIVYSTNEKEVTCESLRETVDAVGVTAMVQKVVEPTTCINTQMMRDVEEQAIVESMPACHDPSNASRKKEKKQRFYDSHKASKKQKVWAVILTLLNIGAISCFVVAYGPFSYLRELYVTTAMKTMTHKYLANVLYNAETIKEILANNTIIEPNEVMDASAISIGNISEPETFSNVYEQQVLQRDEGNDVYKMIKLTENGYQGWLVFVYNPQMVKLGVTKYLGVKGQYVTTFVKQHNAYVGINAGGFKDYGGDGTGGMPSGYVIQDGKVIYKRTREATWGGGTIGFTKNGILTLTNKVGAKAVKMGINDGVDFGPFLIVNGKSAEVNGNGGWGIHPRTIIGQRQDGMVAFLVVDGRSTKSTGIDLNTAIDILKRYHVYNAANLDGGASSALATEGGKLINHPTWYSQYGQRETPTAWLVVDCNQE